MQKDFGGVKSFDWAITDNSGATSNAPGFQTLKTSREVKMERERLRQEKLHRLTQVGFCLQQICLFIV